MTLLEEAVRRAIGELRDADHGRDWLIADYLLAALDKQQEPNLSARVAELEGALKIASGWVDSDSDGAIVDAALGDK